MHCKKQPIAATNGVTGRRDGRFEDCAATAYLALSALLDTDDLPDMGDAQVPVSGVMVSAAAIDELTVAFRSSPGA